MSLKKKIASGLAVGAIVIGSLLVAPAIAQATGNPSALDRGDFSIACKNQYGQSGWTAQLFGNTAYSWKCVYPNSTARLNVDINRYCQTYWGVWAATRNPSSPYSWYCQGY